MVVPDTVHAIGVLDVAKTNGSFFTPSEVCVCESLAAHFAAALQEERSAHAVTASLNHMRILDDVSALSLDSMASSTSMQSTEAVVARALHASTCHIRWRCRADSPTSEQPPHALTAIQTKQLVNVHEAALPDGTRGAALAVPILSDRNAVLGIVCATHKHFDAIKPYFDSCDDRLAQFIARTLAAKRLAHDAAQRENALAALLQRMASPTLPERPLAETLVDIELSMAKVRADLVTVLVVEGTTLVSHIQNNGECIRDGLATSVASTAAPLLLPSAGIPCVRRHRAFHPVIDQGTAAVASVPIFAPHAPSQVLGVLHAVHTHGTWGNWPPPMAFLAGDIDTLEAVSASITVLVERLAMEQLLFSIRTRRTMSEDDKSLDDDVGADVSVASRQCFHQAIQALVDSCTRQDDATPPRFHVHPPATPPLAHRPPDTSLADELKLWTFDPFQAAWPKDVLVDHAVAIFQEFSLHQHFQMDRPTLRRFVAAVRDQYRDVPYHNFLHAFTTLHVTFLIVLAQSPPAPDAQTLLERRDVLALFIGAMCHDMNHNGRTNDFHIKTRTATAMLYNDQSVLENMHAAHCFDTLRRPGHNVLEHASCGDYMFIRKAIIRIQQLSERFHRDVFHPDKDKELLLNAIVHAADIANPALATPLHARWSNALMEEFNAQYEEEIAVGVAPNAYMSAKIDSPDQARMNMRFIDLFCLPLWQHMACFLHGLDGCMDNIRANRAYWAIKADDSTTVT
ncbi:hypothetical protein DYB32_000151 [Aphanomyces invadans]|uniref:Phosphodiesterase n=1 Tax=Aphanomyces invadans TaxID=157072 RepID=A0A3R7AGJ5_9STRA|nr:hypothetical protein DYB32_000151 [Aphanomyces invadans]